MVTFRKYTSGPCMCFSWACGSECNHQGKLSRRQFEKLLFDFCFDCVDAEMGSVPQGVFIAHKVRENQEMMKQKINLSDADNRQPRFDTKYMELSPLKYNSKLMNSIWGLYNRYSVHNFKMNTDAKMAFNLVEQQRKNIVVAQKSADITSSTLSKSLDSVWPITMGHPY